MSLQEQAYELSHTLFAKKKYTEAVKVLMHLTCLYPTTIPYWFSLAGCLHAAKDYEKAITAWSITQALDKENPEPLFHKAECLFLIKKREDALKAIEECEKLLRQEHHSLKKQITYLREYLCQ